MKDATKAPSTLDKLREMIDDGYDPKTEDLKYEWLSYIYSTLSARKAYHKKQQMKKALLLRAAREVLAKDELEALEQQAEEKAIEQLGGDDD